MDKKILLNRLSPYIRLCLNHKVSNMVLKPRIIFDYELLYLVKGQLRIEIEQDNFPLYPGEMVLFRPGKRHSFISVETDEEAWMPHVHFDVEYYENSEKVPINFKTLEECTELERGYIRSDLLASEGLEIPDVIRIDNHQDVYNTLMQMIILYEKRDPDTLLIQRSLLLKILYLIQQGLRAKKDPDLFKNEKSLERAAEYIITNYFEKINVDKLAKISCLSIYYFERLFIKKYGMPPIRYHMMVRIEKAKELIIYSSMSLTGIADKIGYGSIHAFSKAFKKIEGISPSNYSLLYKK